MGEVLSLRRQTLRNSVIRFLVGLHLIWPFVESDNADCGILNFGSLYMGTKNVTNTGKVCQNWRANYPHAIVSGVIDPWQFPDNLQEDAQNFCRNPLPNFYTTLWCYTTDPAVELEYCDVCTESNGNYSGFIPEAAFDSSAEQSQEHSADENSGDLRRRTQFVDRWKLSPPGNLEQIDEYATVATTNAPEGQNNIILIVIIAVGVLGILLCACGGFIFYRYKKGKTGSDERKPLIDQTAAKATNQTTKPTSSLKIKKSAAGVTAVPLQTIQSTPQGTPQATQTAPAVPLQVLQSTPKGTPQATQTAPAVPLQVLQSTPKGTPQTKQTPPAVPVQMTPTPQGTAKTMQTPPAVPVQMTPTPHGTPQSMQTPPAVPVQMTPTPQGTPQTKQTPPAVPVQMTPTPQGTPQSMQTAPDVPLQTMTSTPGVTLQAIQPAPINAIKTTPG